MNNKRNYPLFIIDDSRSHGRGQETDYISCTSNEIPFVAQVTLHHEHEYAEMYNPGDFRTVWSDPHNDIRMRIQVISSLAFDVDQSQVRSLLRRALKEMLIRRKAHSIDIRNIKDEDVTKWADLLLQQTYESLRENPTDKTQMMHVAILNTIKEKFS